MKILQRLMKIYQQRLMNIPATVDKNYQQRLNKSKTVDLIWQQPGNSGSLLEEGSALLYGGIVKWGSILGNYSVQGC